MKTARIAWLVLLSGLAFGCKERGASDSALRADETAGPATDGQCDQTGMVKTTQGSKSGSADVLHYDIDLPQTPIPANAKVVVVGAGLTGLTAAYRLSQAGIEPVVLEAEERIGGRVNTIFFKDCSTAEAHMEEYFERSPAVTLLKELNVPTIVDVAHSSVRIDGKIYTYQGEGDRDTYLRGIFNEDERLAFVEWSEKTWHIYESLHALHFSEKPLTPELKALMKISFKDWMENFKLANGQTLPHKVSEWVRVTVEPEAAIEWDMISALDGIDEARLFLDTPAGFGEKNYHTKGGNIHFIKAIADALAPGSIHTGSRVTGISQDRSKATVTFTQDGQTKKIVADYVVVTVPLYVIDKIKFSPELSAAKKRAIKDTGFGSYVKVHYRLNQSVKQTWAHIGDELFTFLSDSPAGSIYNVSDFGEVTPDQKLTMTLLVHARYAKPLLNLTPEQAGIKTREAIDALLPGFSEHIVDTATYIYPTAVAYWPLAKGR